MRDRGGILAQQLEALVVDGLVVPGRLGQEVLQPLGLAVLRAEDGSGVGQAGQGLLRLLSARSPAR